MMREVFFPSQRIPIASDEELEEFKRLYIGKKNIYESVYQFDGEGKEAIQTSNAIVDKIFLDFDYDEDLTFFDDAKKVVKYLNKSKIKFYIRFSGRGFHIFIELADTKLKNPQNAIREWVQKLHKETHTDSDSSVVGDLRRVCRIMGSMNLKTHLFCIPIDYQTLMTNTYKAICDKAKECHDKLVDYINDGTLLDLSEYDKEKKHTPVKNISTTNISLSYGFPPCIQKMFQTPLLGYEERGQLILFLRDDGYGLDEILSILRTILSDEKFYHCTQEENQLNYLYNREDMMFASCRTLKSKGMCCSNTCTGHNLYL